MDTSLDPRIVSALVRVVETDLNLGRVVTAAALLAEAVGA